MFSKNLVLVVLAVFSAGCGLQFHTYVMTKPRVGLDQSGNAGCIMGKCAPAPAPTETTRKVYVLEISKPLPQSEVRKVEEQIASATPSASALQVPPEPTPQPAVVAAPQSAEPRIVIPPIDDETPAPATVQAAPSGLSTAHTYTVQKDDTLQKIAKKVYGSYDKWYRIYKANKDKIKNPNFVKPGTVLTIPAAK